MAFNSPLPRTLRASITSLAGRGCPYRHGATVNRSRSRATSEGYLVLSLTYVRPSK